MRKEVFYRPDGAQRIQRMINGRGVLKHHYQYDGSRFFYYNIQTKQHESMSKEEMLKLGIDLPLRVQNFLLDIKETKRSMTPQEERDILLLCSLSIYCWNGNPKGKLPTMHIEDYINEFYVQMVKYLTCDGTSRWNPVKMKYPYFVHWIRKHTLNKIFRDLKKEAKIREETSFLNESQLSNISKEDFDYQYRIKHK